MRIRWFIIFLLIPFLCHAQNNELRTLFLGKFHLKNQWNASIDGGFYKEFGHNRWTRWGIRTIAQNRINSIFVFDVGFMYNYVSNKSGKISQEFRPHQTLKIAYPHLRNMTINHRFRLEEQITHTNITEGTDIRSRFRYEIKTKRNITFMKTIRTREPYWIASGEITFNMTGFSRGINLLVERGRYGAGLGFRLSSSSSIEGTYFYQHTHKSPIYDNKTDCNIFNIQFIHLFYIK